MYFNSSVDKWHMGAFAEPVGQEQTADNVYSDLGSTISTVGKNKNILFQVFQ